MNWCSNTCKYCGYNVTLQNTQLKNASYSQLIKQIYTQLKYGKLELHLDESEPCLYYKIYELCEWCNLYDINVIIHTTIWSKTVDIINKVASLSNVSFVISFHYNEDLDTLKLIQSNSILLNKIKQFDILYISQFKIFIKQRIFKLINLFHIYISLTIDKKFIQLYPQDNTYIFLSNIIKIYNKKYNLSEILAPNYLTMPFIDYNNNIYQNIFDFYAKNDE